MKWINPLKKSFSKNDSKLNQNVTIHEESTLFETLSKNGITEDALEFNLQKLLTNAESVLNQLEMAFCTVHILDERVGFVSQQMKEMFGVPVEEITIDTWRTVVHPDDVKQVEKMREKLQTMDKVVHTYKAHLSTGDIFGIKETDLAIRNGKGQLVGMICLFEKTTNEPQKELEQAQNLDTNGLPNIHYGRIHLNQMIKESQTKNKTFAFFYIHLDEFYRINDTFGFQVGDEVLKEIFQRISKFIGNNGFLFRLVANEFGLILYKHKKDMDVSYWTEELIDLIREPAHLKDYDFYLNATIGICHFPTDGKDEVELFKNAHIAYIRAKTLGKGTYKLYSSEMTIEEFKHFQMEADLRHSLENQELYLEYQPRFDVHAQQVKSAEALLRWKHDVWGNVSPAEFLSFAEEGILHEQITNFVIDTVCKQVSEWEQQGVPFTSISFNLSLKDFYGDSLYKRIHSAIEKYKVSPAKLEIEITEEANLSTLEEVLEELVEIKKLGIKIAIDDYGTGYSSTMRLKQLPINTVKIDKIFIQNLSENDEDRTIVQSMIDLLKNLKKNVVIEGVETEDQYRILKAMGCHEIQGYFISKSVPANQMKKWFQRKKVKLNGQGQRNIVEKRKYYRINFFYPLSTEMTILSFKGKKLTLGSTEIMVQNFGLSGLRFLSHLRLMPHDNIIYKFETEVMNYPIQFQGKIVWVKENAKEIYEYGIEFIIEEHERDHLASILNKLTLKLKGNPLFKEGNFITTEPVDYLKEKFF